MHSFSLLCIEIYLCMCHYGFTLHFSDMCLDVFIAYLDRHFCEVPAEVSCLFVN